MPRSWVLRAARLLLGSFLLMSPILLSAQRQEGSTLSSGGGIDALTRPTGVDEKDSLKDFHQIMAVQATSTQVEEFQSVRKLSEAAQSETQALLQKLRAAGAPDLPSIDTFDRTVDAARSANQKFQQGFSAAQKSGLRDVAKRLAKADSDLEQEQKRLDQGMEAKATRAELTARAEALDKALTEFLSQQLAMGREMSIVLASGQDLTFALPRLKTPVAIERLIIPVATSGVLSQTASQGGQRTFQLELLADLSDLQQNITGLLRNQLDAVPTCGQRVAIRQAILTAANPGGLLRVRLHFERWFCARASGQPAATELAESDGTVEIKLAVAVDASNALKVTASLGRIDASGMLAEELRSGALGEDLRNHAVQAILSAAGPATDFKAILPPAVQNSAVIRTARIRETGVGGLGVELDGQVAISDAQADELAKQLNQSLSAQGTPTK